MVADAAADAAAELAGADESLIGFLLVHCLAGNFLVLELLPGELRERVAATQFFFNNGRQHSFFFLMTVREISKSSTCTNRAPRWFSA